MKRALFVVIVLTLIGASVIVVDGLHDEVQVSDVGVVLGSKIMPDGKPSARLRARLDKTADLYGKGMFRHIIVSGGTGKEGFSESRAMAAYLINQRLVPSAAIFLDEYGNNTEATARNSAAIMNAHGLKSALVITQFFHITRSRFALRRAGIGPVNTAHADHFEVRDLYSLARELIALPAYWLGFRE